MRRAGFSDGREGRDSVTGGKGGIQERAGFSEGRG